MIQIFLYEIFQYEPPQAHTGPGSGMACGWSGMVRGTPGLSIRQAVTPPVLPPVAQDCYVSVEITMFLSTCFFSQGIAVYFKINFLAVFDA